MRVNYGLFPKADTLDKRVAKRADLIRELVREHKECYDALMEIWEEEVLGVLETIFTTDSEVDLVMAATKARAMQAFIARVDEAVVLAEQGDRSRVPDAPFTERLLEDMNKNRMTMRDLQGGGVKLPQDRHGFMRAM